MSKHLIERGMAKLASRKWWVWVVVMTLATIGLYLDKLSSSDWVNVVIWVSGLYMGINAVQKLFLRGAKNKED